MKTAELTILSGFVVLYLENGVPYLLDNRVFATQGEAHVAAMGKGLASFEVNVVRIAVPSPGIVSGVAR